MCGCFCGRHIHVYKKYKLKPTRYPLDVVGLRPRFASLATRICTSFASISRPSSDKASVRNLPSIDSVHSSLSLDVLEDSEEVCVDEDDHPVAVPLRFVVLPPDTDFAVSTMARRRLRFPIATSTTRICSTSRHD